MWSLSSMWTLSTCGYRQIPVRHEALDRRSQRDAAASTDAALVRSLARVTNSMRVILLVERSSPAVAQRALCIARGRRSREPGERFALRLDRFPQARAMEAAGIEPASAAAPAERLQA